MGNTSEYLNLYNGKRSEAEHKFKSFNFEEEGDEKRLNKVNGKFDEHFVPKHNVIHERAKFRQRKQQQGESAQVFIPSLYDLAEYCDLGNSKDEQIRDRIVIGAQDKQLSRRLQLKADLDLAMAIQMTRQSELIKSQISDQTQQLQEMDEVQRRRQGQVPRRKNGEEFWRTKEKERQHDGSLCGRCNRKHRQTEVCPARGKQCRNCNKTGHFAAVCRTKNTSEVRKNPEDPSGDETFFLGAVSSSGEYEEPWRIELRINNKLIDFKIDTGADITIISEEMFESLPSRPKLEPSNVVLSSPGGRLNCKGQFATQINHKGESYQIMIFVISGKHSNSLLGRNAACKIGLIQRIAEVQSKHYNLRSSGLNVNQHSYCCFPSRSTLFLTLTRTQFLYQAMYSRQDLDY